MNNNSQMPRPQYPRGPVPPQMQQRPPRRPAPKKSKAPVAILAVLVVLLLALVGAYFLKTNQERKHLEAVPSPVSNSYAMQVNAFRTKKGAVQNALVEIYESLKSSLGAGSGTDLLKFQAPLQDNVFLNADLDWDFHEERHSSNFGRIVIPSIGTDSPLGTETSDACLYYGFCHVQGSQWMDQEGQTTILGHRILTKISGMYFADLIKENDPFYVDDYKTGKRYVYNVRLHTLLEDGHNDAAVNKVAYNIDQAPPVGGKSCLVITCNPLVYNASEQRILTYGQLKQVMDIPADDKDYLDYQARGY